MRATVRTLCIILALVSCFTTKAAATLVYGIAVFDTKTQTTSSGAVDIVSPYYINAFDAVTPPTGSSNLSTPNVSTNALTYSASEGQWAFQSNPFATFAALFTYYGSGTYSVGASGPLTLKSSTVAFPTAIPSVTLVNGAPALWSGNNLILNPRIHNTITWTPLNLANASDGWDIGFFLGSNDGDNVNLGQNLYGGAVGNGTSFNSYTIKADTLTPGYSYAVDIVEVEVNSYTGNSTTGYSGAGYGFQNHLTIQAAPELLIIQTSPTTITLSWPTSATGWTLQETSLLSPTTAWTPTNATPNIVSGQNQVIVSTTNSQVFFRLAPP